MDSLQRSVKQTDEMLRAAVQQLSRQIETMGTSAGHANLARVAKELEISLAQVQRLHRHLEYDLSKLAAIIEGSAAKESADEESADGDTERNEALSRMEAKLDSLTTKVEQVAALEPLVLRSETKVDDVLRICKTANNSQTPTVPRLIAPKPSVSEINERDGGSAYAGTAVPEDFPVLTPVAPAPERLGQPERKKRKMESLDVSNLEAVPPAQSHERQQRELSDDQKNKLRKLTEVRSLTEGILDRLVPCPGGKSWDAYLVFDRFRLLWDTHHLSRQATQLTKYMDAKQSRGWFCVRHMATDGSNSVARNGVCRVCRNWCVQIKPVEAGHESDDNRYYARVVCGRAE
ncbi:hypothetical protein B0I37DRAFT_350868 [Chaetomium sp. MPI-CAGE-AT-0009]|nr:hypothetical protein B0I37DRAFT_350868 [Chaetomium sp. MPI-CAGE-AT-0009]